MIPVPSSSFSSSSSASASASASSLRWRILRQAFLSGNPSSPTPAPTPTPTPTPSGGDTTTTTTTTTTTSSSLNHISRKTSHGFNLIHSQLINQQQQYTPPEQQLEEEEEEEHSSASLSIISNHHHNNNNNNNQGGRRISKDVYVSYTLPLDRAAPKLVLSRRVENHVDLNDFEICNRYDIDNTGLVCHWPSEEVLAYFCLSHAHMFRSKRIIEIGAGYGLAGLVIAASTDALEVVISDGNPQVVDYIKRNIHANSAAFADTKVKSTILHWNQGPDSNILNTFDIIVASDCTFFKEFHKGLAQTVKTLLKHSEASEAIFLSPKRGNSLDKFLEKINEIGMHFSITENYDKEVWCRHQKFLNGDESWPNYEKDHSYPLLLVLTDVVDNGVLVFETLSQYRYVDNDVLFFLSGSWVPEETCSHIAQCSPPLHEIKWLYTHVKPSLSTI